MTKLTADTKVRPLFDEYTSLTGARYPCCSCREMNGTRNAGMYEGETAAKREASHSRFALTATMLCDGHPLSSSPSSRNVHEYPHPKEYKQKQSHHVETRLNFDEFSGPVRTYHHRFKDPMAFENRYKEVMTADPNSFRKSKGNGEIKSANLDSFGNLIVPSEALLIERTANVSRRSSSTGGRAATARCRTASTRTASTNISGGSDPHRDSKGWTRLSKTNIGIPNISKDMSKNNVSIIVY